MDTMIDWKSVMQSWSSELLATELVDRIDREARSFARLRHPPADPAAIADLEARLGLALPPSYRTFLEFSDGWGRLDAFIGRVRPASEVDWFVRENEQWADVYANSEDPVDEHYLTYGDEGVELSLCGSHTKHLIQISDVEDGVLVLNPLIQSRDGEWEAWFFANWVPGASRYASFAHLMLAMYRSMRSVNQVKQASFQIPTPKVPSPTEFTHKKPSQIKSKGKKKGSPKSAPTWTEIVQQLSRSIEEPDKKLMRTLAGKLKGRFSGERDAALTQQFSEIFARSNNSEVRSLCIQAITEFAPDGPPPAVLRRAYDDDDVSVMLSAVFSHHYFPQPDAVSLFCRLIARDISPIYKENIISILGELGDEAAIPALTALLFDTSNTFDQSFGSVGVALGRIGSASYEVLKSAAVHPDRRVRLAAAVGLDVSGDPRAIPILDQLVADADPAVSTRATQRVGRWPL